MERFAWPNEPWRKHVLIALWIVATLIVVTGAVSQFVLHQKAWSNVLNAAFYANFGLLQWFFAEMSVLPTVGRRIFAVFLWAFSASLLFL